MSGRISKYEAANLSADRQSAWQCGVYLRLSRDDGDRLESDSIANQRKIIDRYIEKTPDINIYDYYIDDGYTGTNFNRPSMIRLLEDIKNLKVNCLIVKDLSRFGRNYHETGRYLEVVFPLLKLRFISVNDNIDSFKSPQSLKNSTVSFKNVMNDEYGRDISCKVRSSFNAKRKRGDYIGSFALYGYLKDPEDRHKLIIDVETAENVRLIYRMFLDGISIYNIALKLKELGVLTPTEYKSSKGFNNNNKMKFDNQHCGWSTETIRRMLQNEMYIGNMVQGKYQKVSYKIRKNVAVSKDNYIIKEGTHEAIIDKEAFEKVQAKFKRDTWQSKGGNINADNLFDGSVFVGYIKCADCGRAMQRTGYIKGNNSFYYFVCGSYLQWKQCARHATRVKKLVATVLMVIQKYVALAVEMDSLLLTIKNNHQENFALTRLKKEIKVCELERDRATKFQNDLYIDLKNEILNKEQYLHFKKEYADKIAELDSRCVALKEEISRSNLEVTTSNSFVETFKKHQNITALTRDVIVELIDMIYVEHNGGIRIQFNFQDSFNNALEMIAANTDGVSSEVERVVAEESAG